LSEDLRENHNPASDRQAPARPSRTLAAKSAGKDRLAAALRENLKRRKAQVSARQDTPASE
jgi:hypothetical protein